MDYMIEDLVKTEELVIVIAESSLLDVIMSVKPVNHKGRTWSGIVADVVVASLSNGK